MAKRPWTQNIETKKLLGGDWALFRVEESSTHKRTYRLDDEKRGVFTEANARLFAAAPALYEAAHNSMIIVMAQLEAMRRWDAPQELIETLEADISETVAALRAANPDAFKPTPTGQASEPEGDEK